MSHPYLLRLQGNEATDHMTHVDKGQGNRKSIQGFTSKLPAEGIMLRSYVK